MGADLTLGIDLGTSGVRAIAIDSEGAVIDQQLVDLPAPAREGARVQQDPELWWQGVEACLLALFQRLDPQRIAALAVDGTSGTVLLCTPDGRPLTPALMYNDSRAQAQVEKIRAHAPADSPCLAASSGLAKLLWLQENYPVPQVARLQHQADWIAGRLDGRFDLSDSNNALKSGYDPIYIECPRWLAGLGVAPACLPQVLTPGQQRATITPATAQRFGLRPDTRVVAGTTDSTAALIATGAHAVGTAVTSLGSTLVIKVISDHPISDTASGVYSQPFGERWLVGGASNSGGAVLLQHFSREQLQTLSALLDPDTPTGLDYYPLPAKGERFPINDPELSPRLTPRPADDVVFLQALLEGIARIEQQGYQRLHELGAPYTDKVYTLGGGSSNNAWTKIRQRLLGVPVVVSGQQQAAYGGAVLARGDG